MTFLASILRRPIALSLLAFGLIIAGTVSYHRLGVAELPQVDLPYIAVTASLPGANAQTMASTVMAPLERHLSQISGVQELNGTAREGSATVTMLFDYGTDPNAAAQAAQAAINAAAVDLPSSLTTPPQVFKADTTALPVIIVTITSATRSAHELYALADRLVVPSLSRVDGVAKVEISGGSPPSIRVALSEAALVAKGLTANDVSNAIRAANSISALGDIGGRGGRMAMLRTSALAGTSDFAKLVVASRGGAPVRLSEVADVKDGQEDVNQRAWFNGERAISLQVTKKRDANAVATVDSIRGALDAVAAAMPADVQAHALFDSTKTTRSGLREVELTLLLSALAVAVTIFAFLRRMALTLIAMLSIPLSLSGAFIVMWFLHITLNTMSLVALVLAIGFVVDDAIVVIENVVRHIDAGKRPDDAAIDATTEIVFTILSITLSLFAIFCPMLLGHNVLVLFIREFALTMTAAIVVSAMVSVTIIPSLCGVFLRREQHPSGQNQLLARARQPAVRTWGERLYASTLAWSLRHRTLMRWQPFLLTAVTFFAAYEVIVTAGGSFFPDEDLGQLQMTVRAGANVSPQWMASHVEEIAAKVLAEPDVLDVTAVLGGDGGAIGNRATLSIDLQPLSSGRASAGAVADQLRSRFSHTAEVAVSVASVQTLGGGGEGGGEGVSGQFQLQFVSSAADGLRDATLRVAKLMRARTEFRDVETTYDFQGNRELIEVDRDTAARLGVSLAAVDDAIYNTFGQRYVSTIYSDVNAEHVIITSQSVSTMTPEALLGMYVRAQSGRMIPLAAIASLRSQQAPRSIVHRDQLESATVAYNLAPGVTSVNGLRLSQQLLDQVPLPPGVQRLFAGNNERLVSSALSAVGLLGAVIAAMYVLLGVLYESLTHPLTILSTLPAAGAGAFIAMLITGTPMTLMSVIAVLMLIGIVKKNAIMLVDFAVTQERECGLTPEEAITMAALERFRPIMMTTLAAMAPAITLAIGFGEAADARRPLGIAMLGGLILSQCLTLLSTPAIYLRRSDRKARQADRHRLRRSIA
ncbi:MAG TPA: efflux RND transporter permease subunit [Steroidobacteraceae bacterium]|jgi:multidrug efflux pump